MKQLVLISIFIAFMACNNSDESSAVRNDSGGKPQLDTSLLKGIEHSHDTIDLYLNQRFKDVRVKKIADSTYSVSGKAQVFEAAYSWVVEDGHEELLSGHGMTDAGAPAFGNFSFTFNVMKKRAESKLHLVLFESSPKDGSRQHELPIPLD